MNKTKRECLRLRQTRMIFSLGRIYLKIFILDDIIYIEELEEECEIREA